MAVVVAVVAGALALPFAAASPAAALDGPEACEGTPWAEGAWQLFQPPTEYVPPPLRGHPYSCAAVLSDRAVPDPELSYGYNLFYVDITPDDLVAILRSFEEAGWANGTEISQLDPGAGDGSSVAIGADELAALDAPPSYVGGRFGDANTGADIIAFTYADGQEYDNWVGWETPSLVVEVQVTSGPYGRATGASDPSVLSALRTIAEAVPSSTQLAVLGGSAVFLMLIVGFPGFLLNKVLEKHWTGAMDWLRARRAKRVTRAPKTAKGAAHPVPAAAPARPKRTAPSWLVWPGFVLAAIIAGFVDPAFGFNPMSVRLVVTGLISFVLLNVIGWVVVIAALRRIQPDAHPTITFRFGSLIVVALTVLVARLLQFEPGVIFGLVAGLTFAITLAASKDALVILLGSGAALVMAIGAWIGYSAFGPLADAVPGSVIFRSLAELFSGIVVEGVSTLPLALLPLLALDGAVLFAWHKWVWGVAYAVGAGSFVLVMFTIPEAWGEIGSGFGRWLLLFTGLAVIAVGVWLTDALIERRAKRIAEQTAAAAAATPAAPPPAG